MIRISISPELWGPIIVVWIPHLFGDGAGPAANQDSKTVQAVVSDQHRALADADIAGEVSDRCPGWEENDTPSGSAAELEKRVPGLRGKSEAFPQQPSSNLVVYGFVVGAVFVSVHPGFNKTTELQRVAVEDFQRHALTLLDGMDAGHGSSLLNHVDLAHHFGAHQRSPHDGISDRHQQPDDHHDAENLQQGEPALATPEMAGRRQGVWVLHHY